MTSLCLTPRDNRDIITENGQQFYTRAAPPTKIIVCTVCLTEDALIPYPIYRVINPLLDDLSRYTIRMCSIIVCTGVSYSYAVSLSHRVFMFNKT